MLPVMHDATFGDYTCVASNKLGSRQKVVTLTEGAKPGTPHIKIHKIGLEMAELGIQRIRGELFLEIIGFKEWDSSIHDRDHGRITHTISCTISCHISIGARRLDMSDSAYKSPHDSVHDLHTKGLRF
jgi:hypothetical protein